jgi:signal transduction histidine kinase
MTLEPYYAQRNLTIAAAVAFAAFVGLLGVAVILVVAWKPLRSLEITAALSDERAHLAQMRTRLVTVVSHEFRTPLAVIQVALDALRRYGDRLGAEQREGRMNAIAEAVGQLRDLLTEVIAVDQAEEAGLACALAPTDVGRLCRDVVERADVQASHRVEVSVAQDEPVLLDPELMRQLLRNLLSNAIKYSPPSGRITMAVEREGEELVVRVVDRGIGIPARDLPHLFEPFQRAGNSEHLGGAGLGLASARRAAEAHGGSLTVRSIVGTGSTFEARVPYRAAVAVAPAA